MLDRNKKKVYNEHIERETVSDRDSAIFVLQKAREEHEHHLYDSQ